MSHVQYNEEHNNRDHAGSVSSYFQQTKEMWGGGKYHTYNEGYNNRDWSWLASTYASIKAHDQGKPRMR